MTDALIKHLQAFVDSCRELGQEKQHGSTFLIIPQPMASWLAIMS